MSKLKWDQAGAKNYETGVEMGVLFPMGTGGVYGAGVAWNGLTKVAEAPSGAEPTPLYANNKKYLNLMSKEEFGASLEAYTYPEEFCACDGSKQVAKGVYAGQQERTPFGFAYRTAIGNDVDGTAYGYKLHIVYGATAKPSSKDYGTVNETPEAITFSWELSTTPVEVPGGKPTANLTFDSTKTTAEKMAALEDILYGKDAVGEGTATVARLPLPAEIITLMGPVV